MPPRGTRPARRRDHRSEGRRVGIPTEGRSRARAARRAPTATRAFLFSDLRDYTRFVESRGDAAAAVLLRDYRALVRREVQRHAGAEVKTEGDSFYVVFTMPSAALECAVAILRRAAEHSRTHPERQLRIGMGLHAGETVEFDDQFVGSAVNVGARLASKAGAGELIVSDTFRGLVRTASQHRMTDRGPLRLKGVGERIRGWRVEWQPSEATSAPTAPAADGLPLPTADAPAPPSGELLAPVLVGRSEEVRIVDELIAHAVAGRGGLLLVSGEAGVGKSALMRELQQRAAARGARLLAGVTAESDGGLPYAPFVSALRTGYRDAPERLREVLRRAAPDLAPLFPELGRAARETAGSVVERHRIAVAFATLFGSLSAVAPMVLVLEDMHWADEASLALLQQVAREAPRCRLLMAATYRSDEILRLHPLSRAIATVRRDRLAREIGLAPLTREESAELIAAAVGAERRVSDELREAIYRRAQGNAFFTEELLRAVVDEPRAGRQVPIPATVLDVVRARLGRIGPGARSTVESASVLGERFTFDLLRSIRDVDEVVLSAEIRECVDEQLLVEEEEQLVPEYRFRHALTREVVYGGMLLPERRRLHLRAAQGLAADPVSAAATVAEQWRLGGDARRAADAYERAAHVALTFYGPGEAVGHIERAIEMRGMATVEDYELLAQAYLFFDQVKAREAAERGLELMPPEEPPLRRIRLMHLAGRARYQTGDAAGSADLAARAWDLAEPSGDAAAQAHAADWRAITLFTAGDNDEAGAWAERARDLARASGELAVEGSALVTLASAGARSRPQDVLPLLDEAAAIARRTANAEVMARMHNNGVVHSFAFEAERPRLVRIERAREFAQRYGFTPSRFGAFLLYHELLSLHWPAVPLEARDDGEDLFSAWEEMLGTLISACRGGPAPALLERADGLVARAATTGLPQWTVPWLSIRGLLAAAARDAEGRSAAHARVRAAAVRDPDPPLTLTQMGRGLNTPALLAFLERDDPALEEMRRALERTAGSDGDVDALDAFRAALAGGDALTPFTRAATAFRRRGLAFTVAIDLWALASAGAVDGSWSDAVTASRTELVSAGADWLAADLARLIR